MVTASRFRAAPRFTADDLDAATDAWGCNCGPGSAAAVLGFTLDEIRERFTVAGFHAKRYTNPTMMFAVLNAVGRPWHRVSTTGIGIDADFKWWPWWGICRIQWQGPWTAPTANPRWAYRHTHWIGAAKSQENGSIGVYDVNAMRATTSGDGWTSLSDWERHIRPLLTEGIPRATGGWHVTHALEVQERLA